MRDTYRYQLFGHRLFTDKRLVTDDDSDEMLAALRAIKPKVEEIRKEHHKVAWYTYIEGKADVVAKPPYPDTVPAEKVDAIIPEWTRRELTALTNRVLGKLVVPHLRLYIACMINDALLMADIPVYAEVIVESNEPTTLTCVYHHSHIETWY